MSIRSCPNHLAPFNPHREVSPPISVAALLGGRAVPNRSLKCAVLVARVAGSAPFLPGAHRLSGGHLRTEGRSGRNAEFPRHRRAHLAKWCAGGAGRRASKGSRGRQLLENTQFQPKPGTSDHLALGQVSWVSANHLKLGGCSSDAQCLSRRLITLTS